MRRGPQPIEYITVKDLIEKLSTLDPDLKVGRVGHFGELNAMSLFDFYAREANVPTFYARSWRSGKSTVEQVLDITPPDIGPDPNYRGGLDY